MALMAQAADALHAAHEKGIVHRDVKPGNLLVRPNGTLVLTDFGIARSAAVGQLTAAGSVLGTASYISPEQAAGQGATPLSDVYALGVVAYQCLSGRRPFEGDNPLEIAMRHVRDAPPPLPPDIPAAARQIVETAMAKDPAARYPSAAALGQVARRAAGQLAAASTATRPAVPTGMPGSPMPPGHPGGPPGSPAGVPVSGPAGMPMSGPPGGPVSGPSGPSGPVSAMPAAGFQPGPSGPPPGAYQPGPVSGGPGGGYQPGPISGGPGGGYQPGPVSGGPGGPGGPGGYGAATAAMGGPGPDPAKPGPISGPPSGPPGDVAAGGTRVMPAGGQPTGPAVPGGGPPPAPGQFARGAAGVPPPPQRESDTGYTYAQTSLGPPAAAGVPGPGGTSAPPNQKRTRMIALIAGVGALMLILCIGGGVFLVNNLGDDKNGKGPTTDGSATTAPPAGETETVDCEDLKGKPFNDVRNHLQNKDGFTVKEVPVDSGERAGTVVDVQPCGAQPKGSEVTVSVSNGRGGGNGGPSGGPNGNCGGGFPFGTRCPPSTRR
jgi:hypothetical protein